jgi:hypothetical protein
MKDLQYSKPVSSLINTVWLMFFKQSKGRSERDIYYDWKEGFIYRWQMKLVLAYSKHIRR